MPEAPVSTRPVALRLTLACDLSEVRAAGGTVRQFLAPQGCDETELNACELALVEACNNAIRYASPEARIKPIVVDCLCDDARIELRVTDHTAGFDWPARASLPEPESENGRGIYLMQTLMEEANYFRAAGENVLVLRKRRSSKSVSRAALAPESEQVITAMVEELSSCYESLSAIFRYSAAGNNAGDLKEFAQKLFTDLMHITGADWFVLRLATKSESRLHVFAASEPAFEFPPLLLAPSNADAGSVELEAVGTRREVWFDGTRPLSPRDPLAGTKPDSQGLVHPIFAGEDLIGTLALGKSARARAKHPKPAGLVFTAGQTNVVGTFTEFLAIQVVNARFQEEQVASRLVAHELEIANNIQQSLLLKELPQLPGFELAAFCRSARQVGGDFYDVLRINEHELLLVIADVMGKGVPAAMFAAILRTMLRAAPELTQQPSALLTRVNRLLFEELSGVDMFITAQLAYVNARTRRIVTASAGHCPLLVATAAGDAVRQFSPDGMPLGIMPDTPFAEAAFDLPPGCRVLLYTDGLPEALSASGDRYGHDRLIEWLKINAPRHRTAGDLKHALAETLGQFQANMVLNDDQTFLILFE